MKIYNDCASLKSFDAWSGAVETQERIINEGKASQFDSLIEELYPDGLTDTNLNDLLWFEEDWLFEMLGIKDEE
jgi:hypothetical protein